MRCLSPESGLTDSSERGDTLVEVLVALIIIAIAVVGLVGGLVESVSASGSNRQNATLDALVKTFAQDAQYVIQQQSALPGPGPQYSRCAGPGTYQFVSSPFPREVSSVSTTSVTVFGTGFTGGSGPSVQLVDPTGGLHGMSVTSTTIPQSAFGNLAATFSVPPGLAAGAYLVRVTDGNTLTSSVPVSVGTVVSGNSGLVNAAVGLSKIEYWDSTSKAFVAGSCPSSSNSPENDIQRLTIAGSAPGSADEIQLVVANPNHPLAPSVSISESVATLYPQENDETLTATVSPPSVLTSTPTGSMVWSLPSGVSCMNPGSGTLSSAGGNAEEASCSLSPVPVGSYFVSATYSGDTYYRGAVSATVSIPVNQAQLAATFSNPSSPQALGQSMSWTASLQPSVPYSGEPNESQTSVWSFPGAPAGSSSCSTTSQNVSAGVLTTSCTISSPLAGTYIPTVTYPTGDANYAQAVLTDGTATTVSKAVPTVSFSYMPAEPAPGDTVVVTAVIAAPSSANPIAPSGSPAWSWGGSPSGAPACTGTSLMPILGSSPPAAQTTCTINSALAGTYIPKLSYNGDSNYSALAANPTTGPSVVVHSAPAPSWTTTSGPTSVTFTLVLTGSTAFPTSGAGTVTFTIAPAGTCTPTQILSNGNKTLTATCVVGGASSGTIYTATANFPGDSVYGDLASTSPPASG